MSYPSADRAGAGTPTHPLGLLKEQRVSPAAFRPTPAWPDTRHIPAGDAESQPSHASRALGRSRATHLQVLVKIMIDQSSCWAWKVWTKWTR